MDIEGVVVGLAGGILASGFQWWLARDDRRQQRERVALEIKQLGDAVRDSAESIRHRLPGLDEYEFYRSAADSPTDDLKSGTPEGGMRSGATGAWSFTNGVLAIERSNTRGEVWIRLNRYRFERAVANVIHGAQSGVMRSIRVGFEARAVGGHHTVILVLKSPADPDGVHLGADQRVRIRDEEFLYFEKWFTYPAEKDAYLRFIERSPSPAGSSVEVRNIVVGERVAAT